MKTKHILTALALPAMFAACTADDIVSENNGLQQAERAKLSKDFVLNINNGVESRYAVEGNTGLEFNYGEGDQVGANLIDAYDPTEPNPAKWNIVAYVAPSLPFKFVGGEDWKSDAELGVGNYLFTYPFNAKDNGRAAAQFELPRIQKYDSENLNGIIVDNNKAVGAVVLTEGQTEAEVSMKNLYTYPKVVINFDNGEEVKKVTKVILQKTTGNFIYKGGIHHEAVAAMFYNEEKWVENYMENKDVTKEEAKAVYWAQFETTDFIIDNNIASGIKNADGNVVSDAGLYNYGTPAPTPYLIVEMDEAVKANSTTNNKSVEVRLMMPSEKDFAATNIVMHIVTDNGTYGIGFNSVDEDIVFKTDNEAKIKAALSRSSANTLRTKNLKLANDKSTGLGNIVTTAVDWNTLVENKKAATQDVEVSILSDEFALTKDLKMPENAKGFTIATPISVEGAVELSNINVTNTVVVKKDAVLTTSKSFVASVVRVEEGGELKFAAELNDKDEVVEYDGITSIENFGTVTVPADVIAKVNLKDMTNDLNLANANTGVLNVGSASRAAGDAVANLYGRNYGTINNYGIINAYGFLNETPAHKNIGYEQDEETGEWDGAPTINNYGTFNVPTQTTTNKALFVNAGILTSNIKNGIFKNETFSNKYPATLEVKDGATTFIDSNKGAVIVLEKVAPANFTIFDAKELSEYVGDEDRGTIKYVATGKEAIELKNSPVNLLVAEGAVELKNTFTYTAAGATKATVCALPNLDVMNGGSVKIAATTGTGTSEVISTAVTNLNIKGGDATVGADMNTVANIVVAKDATLTVPSTTTLTIASYDAVSGEGVLQVNGILAVGTESGDATGYVANPSIPSTSIITLGKQGKVYGVKYTAPSDDAVGKDVTYTSGTLKAFWTANFGTDTNDYVKSLTINGSIDMSAADGTDKNSAYTKVFNKAVILGTNGAITNLTKAMAVTSESIVVEHDAKIQGTANLEIMTTSALTVNQGATLTVEDGWLVINTVAVKGQNCEDINIKGYVNGVIAAKNASGEYLFWNVAKSVWEEAGENGVTPNTFVTVEVSTLDGLKTELEKDNVSKIKLLSAMTMNGELNLKGKTLIGGNIYINGARITNGVVDAVVTVNKDYTSSFENVTFNKRTGLGMQDGCVDVYGNVTFKGCTFDNTGRALDVDGSVKNVIVEDCVFKSNEGVNNPYFNPITSGSVTLKNNLFECNLTCEVEGVESLYTISGNTFKGTFGIATQTSVKTSTQTFLNALMDGNTFEGEHKVEVYRISNGKTYYFDEKF